MQYRWLVRGTAYSASPGAMRRTHEDEDIVEADNLPEALLEAINHSSMWEGLDIDCGIVIEIGPVPDAR